MTTNEGYYGVTRTDEYLAHYGIKGMKWGVRKAIESGNSARLGRQYRKAQKKLAKLEARANNGKKYAKRAAALGAGAAAAGGLAAVGTGGVASGVRAAGRIGSSAMMKGSRGLKAAGQGVHALADRVSNKRLRTAMRTASRGMTAAGERMQSNTFKVGLGATKAAANVEKWGNQTHNLANTAGHLGRQNNISLLKKVSHDKNLRAVSNNTLARVGAGAAAAGLGAGAAYNAYRAATTKRAAKKAAQFRSEMNKAFAGTPYDRRKNRQGGRRRG